MQLARLRTNTTILRIGVFLRKKGEKKKQKRKLSKERERGRGGEGRLVEGNTWTKTNLFKAGVRMNLSDTF